MTKTEMRAKARKFTKTNATNYPDADLDVDLDQANKEVHELIREAEGQENIGIGIKVADLVSVTGLVAGNSGFNGEYANPADCTISEVHLDYGDGFKKAEMIDKSDLKASMFEDEETYTAEKPKVFIFRDTYIIRPLATTTVAGGIKLVVNGAPAILGADESPSWAVAFHLLVPLKVALDYYLIYPDKYNARIERKANDLEAQLISKVQSENPMLHTFKTVKEQF